MQEYFQRRLQSRAVIQEETDQNENIFLSGRHLMIFGCFKASNTSEADMELKNDNVQSFNAQWDETFIAMRSRSKMPTWRAFTSGRWTNIRATGASRSLYTVDKGEERNHIKLKQMVMRYIEEETRNTRDQLNREIQRQSGSSKKPWSCASSGPHKVNVRE